MLGQAGRHKMSNYIKYVKYEICDNNTIKVFTQGWYSTSLTTSKYIMGTQESKGVSELVAGLTSMNLGPPVCL